MRDRTNSYGGKWPTASAAWLKHHPWCAICAQLGQRVPATDVDHIVRWQDHPQGFWDRKNWRGLCRSHHASKSGREAHGLREKYGVGQDGWPLDPAHWWNKR